MREGNEKYDNGWISIFWQIFWKKILYTMWKTTKKNSMFHEKLTHYHILMWHNHMNEKNNVEWLL